MGFAGSGTISYDNKMGTLEYATQEILRTRDDQVFEGVKSANTLFSDVRKTLLGWNGLASGYYAQDLSNQSKLLSDLNDLKGVVGGLPAVIDRSVSKTMVPVLRISEQVTTISTVVSQLYTSMEASRTSINELVGLARQTNTLLDNIAQNKPSGGSEVPSINLVNDFTPDYSGALEDISDIIGSIRDSISGFDGNIDLNSLYPGIHRDLDSIRDVIGELADKYTSPEGFDTEGFTKDVGDLLTDFAEALVQGVTNEIVPGMSAAYEDFTTQFLLGFKEEYEKQSSALVSSFAQQSRLMSSSGGSNLDGEALNGVVEYLSSILDVEKQFHADTIEWLENIDKRLSSSFTRLDTSVRRSGGTDTGRSKMDDIDSFDEANESSISTGKTVSSIFSWLKNSGITDYLATIVGMFTFANIADHMERIHADTRQILQATGGTRGQALDLRGAVNSNLFSTYGKATLSQDEREAALADALRSGAVSRDHLQQISEVTVAYNKLLGTTIDFSQGWAKALMVTKTNADEYLESVAIGIDDFSNAFYVSADVLQKAAENYSATARVFSTDIKSFSKSVNSAVQLQAAQEASAVQSMDIPEWIDHLASTFVGDWSDADVARAVALGRTDLFQLAEDARRDPAALGAALSAPLQSLGEKADRMLNSGPLQAQVALGQFSHLFEMSATKAAADSKGNFEEFGRIAAQGDITKNGDISSLKDRTETVANNNHLEQLQNIASALRDDPDSIPGKILTQLEKMGVSPKMGGIVSGIITTAVTSILLKGGSKLLGKAFSDVAGKAAMDAAAKGASEAGAGFLSKLIPALTTWTPAGAGTATLGNGGVLSAGILGTAIPAIIGLGMGIKDAVKGINDWTSDEDSGFRKAWTGLSGFVFGSGKGIGEEGATAGDVAMNAGGNALKGAALGAAIGSIIPVGGTAIGAAIGGGVGLLTGLVGGKRIADIGRAKESDVTNGDAEEAADTSATESPWESQMEPASDVTHTGKPAFTDTGSGRKGLTSASGLNRYTYTDYVAKEINENNTPIEHTPGEGKTAKDFGIVADDASAWEFDGSSKTSVFQRNIQGPDSHGLEALAREAGDNPDVLAPNLAGDLAGEKEQVVSQEPVLYGSKEYEEITNKPKTRDVDLGQVGDSDVSEDVTELESNTVALKDLTAAIQQAYGNIAGTPDVTEQSTDVSRETNATNLDQKSLIEMLAGGASGILGLGLAGPFGVMAGKAIDDALGKEVPERVEGPLGVLGGVASTVLGSGFWGVPGVLASKAIDKFTTVPAEDVTQQVGASGQGTDEQKRFTEVNVSDIANLQVAALTTGLMKTGLLGPGALLVGGVLDQVRSGLIENAVNPVDAQVPAVAVDTSNYVGPDNISAPIVASIDNNMNTVIGLLERLVGNQNTGKGVQQGYPKVPPTPPVNDTNNMVITNYQSNSGVMA